MSLVINSAGLVYGMPGAPKEYVVTAADIANGGAFVTVDINLDNLPAGAVLNAARIKHSVALGFGVGNDVLTATARLYFNASALGSGTLDVLTAPSNTAGTGYITDITGNGLGLFVAVNVLMMRVTITHTATTDLNACVSGEIHAWVDYTVMGEAVLINTSTSPEVVP